MTFFHHTASNSLLLCPSGLWGEILNLFVVGSNPTGGAMGLFETIHGTEITRHPKMTMSEWMLRAGERTTLLVQLHRLHVPDYALWWLVDMAVPLAIDDRLQHAMITEAEVKWLESLKGFKVPWYVRLACKLWQPRVE